MFLGVLGSCTCTYRIERDAVVLRDAAGVEGDVCSQGLDRVVEHLAGVLDLAGDLQSITN